MNLFREPEFGLKLKKKLDGIVSQYEYCIEALPSTVLLVTILMQEEILHVREIIGENPIGPMISVLSGSFGMAKSIKNGSCRIFRDCDGLLSGKFVITFFACLTGLVSRGLSGFLFFLQCQ